MRRVYRWSLGLLMQVAFFLQARNAFAAELCPSGFENLCKLRLDNNGAGGLVGKILSILLIIAIVLSLIYLVYGGIKYITSGGDKAKVDGARSHITAAIVGLVIAFMAFFIVNIITYVVTGKGLGSFTIPKLVP